MTLIIDIAAITAAALLVCGLAACPGRRAVDIARWWLGLPYLVRVPVAAVAFFIPAGVIAYGGLAVLARTGLAPAVPAASVPMLVATVIVYAILLLAALHRLHRGLADGR